MSALAQRAEEWRDVHFSEADRVDDVHVVKADDLSAIPRLSILRVTERLKQEEDGRSCDRGSGAGACTPGVDQNPPGKRQGKKEETGRT